MFRFTIRDVLWLTVVVALAVSWWAEWSGRTVGFVTTVGNGEHDEAIGLQPGYKAITRMTSEGQFVTTIERDD